MEQFSLLLEKVKKYNPKCNVGLLEKTYTFCKQAHEGQFRRSGEPYYNHPFSVAEIIAELNLDDESICAALLHDTIEDTPYGYEYVKKEFGEDIANIVDGVTKLGQITFSSKEEEQIENLRKMFMAMAKDIRVILIKLADRLHNMRTMKSMPEAKRLEKALETMEIYAPIAHRLGIYNLKWELEDLSLMYLDPVGYKEISTGIAKKRTQRLQIIDEIKEQLMEKLSQIGVQAHIEGRAKHFYSIYKKMYSKNITLDEIYDLFALRIIVGNITECYTVLGCVHELYKPIPGRFKDYISMPKQNMYQSLHTTLVSHAGTPFEIQIRTWDMHRTAEYGIAAHWKYKEGSQNQNGSGDKFQWVRQLLETEKDFSNPSEYISHIKIDLFADEVFVFSPKGDVYSLPSGSTPIDFAFMVHSAVGWRMVGAKVNNRIVPIDQKLENGDIVEIITSANSVGPHTDWLKIARTSQARSKINQWFKKEKREENIQKGKEKLEKEIKKFDMTLKDLVENEDLFGYISKKYSVARVEDFYAIVGNGGITAEKIGLRIEDYLERTKVPDDQTILDGIQNAGREKTSGKHIKKGIVVKGQDNCLVRTAKCCSPVPGDQVVGYITRGRGVTIHRADCIALRDIERSDGDRSRLVEATWEAEDGSTHSVDLAVTSADRSGLLVDLTLALNDMKVPVNAMTAKVLKDGTGLIQLTIEVTGQEQLSKVLSRLNNVKSVISVTRV
ncbi:MAG: bifunctional (p)ppGpp synthetase/guanosine-3',5'-bis(diphosphate) 3'-pyrophosphohydrolase [Clostridia bacterium]|nr:bifunctional (p)ppGpp synthetase/guanosine-3',5'-bis(diphosphate) 3'-pyrophosphohydrolase [Clostridia bacterium]